MAVQLERVHPMDAVIRAMAEFAAPSRTDGMTPEQRTALPAVTNALKAEVHTSTARFARTLAPRA